MLHLVLAWPEPELYHIYNAYTISVAGIPSIVPEVVDGAKVLKMSLFRCKSCLNNTTRCFMKFEAEWTTQVVWAEIQFKCWH
jgi:hypothetical protein